MPLAGEDYLKDVAPENAGPAGQRFDIVPAGGAANTNAVQTTAPLSKAMMWTVQFNITYPQGLPRPSGAPKYAPIQALAVIRFTVGGNTIQRKVTIANGITLSGLGDSCSVVVTDQTPGPAPGSGPPFTYLPYPLGTTYSVSVSIAPGTRPSTQQQPILYDPTLSFRIGAAATRQIPIDQTIGASNVLFLIQRFTPPPGPIPMAPAIFGGNDCVVWFQNGNDLADAQDAIPFFPERGIWVPIPGGMIAMRIQTGPGLTVGDQLNVQPIFGVDG